MVNYSRKSVWLGLLLVSIGVHSARGQWVEMQGSYGGTINAFAVVGDNLFAATNDGIFLSTDSGTSWRAVDGGLDGRYVKALVASGTTLFAGTDRGVFLSTNNGMSWGAMDSALPPYAQVSAFAVLGNDTSTFLFAGTTVVDGYASVFVTSGPGESWVTVDSLLTVSSSVNAFAVSRASAAATLFVGTDHGLFLISDTGSSWTTSSAGFTDTVVKALTFSGSNLIAATDSGLFLSTNNGANWSVAGQGLHNDAALVNVLADAGSSLFAGTHGGGFFWSTNHGVSWTAENKGFSSLFPTYLYALAISGPYIFAGDANGNIWRRALSDFSKSSVLPVSTPVQHSLANYPNPFSHFTTISFTSPEAGLASVEVVNGLGEDVANIFEGQLETGKHTFSLDASGMGEHAITPGMYECIVRMNGTSMQIPILYLP